MASKRKRTSNGVNGTEESAKPAAAVNGHTFTAALDVNDDPDRVKFA